MSEVDKIELAELIQKGKAIDIKWNIYKIVSVVATILISITGSTLYIGYQMGDWRAWRTSTTNDITEIKSWKQGIQSSLNSQRAEYNRNIKIK